MTTKLFIEGTENKTQKFQTAHIILDGNFPIVLGQCFSVLGQTFGNQHPKLFL